MRVLILGGDGFVGANVTEVLRNQNHVCLIASRKTGCDFRILGEVTNLYNSFKPDVIVNCAAHVGSLNYVTQNAAEIVLDNTKMILSIYEGLAITGLKSLVINPIANCAYPAKADTFIEDNWWDGHLHRSVLSYGSTRRTLWSVAECFAMQYKIRTISLLVPNMFGEHDSTDPNKAHALNALISKFVKAEKSNQPELEIWGTGIAIREWLYAKDFGRIVSHIINYPDTIGLDEPINIAQNFGLSVKELVGLIKKSFDYKGQIVWNVNMPDGAPKKVMEDSKFKKVFPNFEFTKLEDGIRNTIEYYNLKYPY
jgi:GDP-L-fucose synthase